ncbi:MAG: hypothetical protein ABI543_11170 [Ignavibacteria bacterium]
MKLIVTFLFFALTISLCSQSRDTTIKYDLNFDGNDETIKCTYNETTLDFTIQINNAKLSGTFIDSYDMGIEIIDINRNDNLREVLIKGYGSSDQNDMYFYQFIDGKIVECGHLPSNFGVEAKGNSQITEFAWMGFWTAKLRYDFDTREKTLTKVDDEFYDVKQDCEVINSFKLLSCRDDNSVVALSLTPKTKLTIIMADITPTCKYEDGTNDDFSCDWFLFKTSDGKQGWCRLKDFQQNVDGLVWAG